MNNNEDFLKYQKILNQGFKRKFKSFVSAEVDPESFEKTLMGDTAFNFFDVTFTYNVTQSVKQEEEIKGVTKFASSLFQSMFNKDGFAWINLNFEYDRQ